MGRWGRGTNVQGSAFDIKANESARRRGEVARTRMLNSKVIKMKNRVTTVSAVMP